MTERRPLVAGLKTADPKQQKREEAFVYGDSAETSDQGYQPKSTPGTTPPAEVTNNASDTRILPQYAGRVPITARTRPEIASTIKRAALTRQLDGVEPHTIQDIVEEALELWLLTNNYLQK